MRSVLLGSIVLCTTLSGCRKNSDITPDELAAAFGVKAWTVQMPSHIRHDDPVELVLVHASGEIITAGGSTGFRPAEKVRVLIWKALGDDNLHYSIQRKGDVLRSTLINTFPSGKAHVWMYLYDKKGDVAKAGDYLMKASESAFVSVDPWLSEKEYGVKLVVKKPDRPAQSGEGCSGNSD